MNWKTRRKAPMMRGKFREMKSALILIFLLGALALNSEAQTGVAGGSGSAFIPCHCSSALAFARAAKLKRGINASEWFAQVYDKRGYTAEHFQAWTTAEDIALIKSMGFDHVRLSVNPQPPLSGNMSNNLFDPREPNKIPAEYLGSLDAAVKMILDHGLAVVIDMHPEGELKARLARDDDYVERFADFWRTLAAHYSAWDADRVFLEVMNEPEFSDLIAGWGCRRNWRRRFAKALRSLRLSRRGRAGRMTMT